MKRYVDTYKNHTRRIDVFCPHCNALHSVYYNVITWQCKDCDKDFRIPAWAMLKARAGLKVETVGLRERK